MIGDTDAETKRRNQLSQLVGDVAAKNEAIPVHINQDVNLYVAELDGTVAADAEPLKFDIVRFDRFLRARARTHELWNNT